MSKKRAIAGKQRRSIARTRSQAEKAAESRVIEATEDDDPKRDEQSKRANVESLRQLRNTIAKCEKGYQAQLIEILSEIYRHAWDLQAGSMKVWRAFLKEDFFVGKKLFSPRREIKNAFTRVCEYGFAADTASKRKRTCKFGKTLNYFSRIGVEPDNLIAEIKKAGGLEKSYKLSVEHRKAKPLERSSGVVSAKGQACESSKHGGVIESKELLQGEDQELNNDTDVKVKKESRNLVLTEQLTMNTKRRSLLHDMQIGQEARIVCTFLGEDDQGLARYKVCRVKRTKITQD